jgi:hypothetical protein
MRLPCQRQTPSVKISQIAAYNAICVEADTPLSGGDSDAAMGNTTPC